MQKYWTHFWHTRYGNCYTFNKGMDGTGTHVDVMNTSQPGFGNYFFFLFGRSCPKLKELFGVLHKVQTTTDGKCF